MIKKMTWYKLIEYLPPSPSPTREGRAIDLPATVFPQTFPSLVGEGLGWGQYLNHTKLFLMVT